jgi:geranylgeranylglycerol-phosphate geranylgeranyltransferase
VNKYLRLFRFGNGLMGILGVIAGALIASGTDVVDHWYNVTIACAVVVLFIAGGNAFSDYIRRDIDKVAQPERPRPPGEMAPRTALAAGSVVFAVSIAISFLLWDILCVTIVIAACALMLSYELFLKRRGFVGNVTIAILIGMLFLLGGAAVFNIEIVIIAACMAVIVNSGREIAKDVEDLDGDEGRTSLPMPIGLRNACAVASVMLIAGPALSILPIITNSFGPLYYLILAADAVFIYSSYIVHSDARKAQKLCKYAMLVALAAFILGAVYP